MVPTRRTRGLKEVVSRMPGPQGSSVPASISSLIDALSPNITLAAKLASVLSEALGTSVPEGDRYHPQCRATDPKTPKERVTAPITSRKPRALACILCSFPVLFVDPAVLSCSTWGRCGVGLLGRRVGGGPLASELGGARQLLYSHNTKSGHISSDADLKADLWLHK